MLQYDIRGLLAPAGTSHAGPRAKWALGMVAAICLIGGSARQAAAGPPAGCTSEGVAICSTSPNFMGALSGCGYTWQDTPGDYHDQYGNQCLYVVGTDGGYDNYTGYWADITWELDIYDANGNFVDYWIEDRYDAGISWDSYNQTYLVDSALAPFFYGTTPESGYWGGSSIVTGGWTFGWNYENYLYCGSCTD